MGIYPTNYFATLVYGIPKLYLNFSKISKTKQIVSIKKQFACMLYKESFTLFLFIIIEAAISSIDIFT